MTGYQIPKLIRPPQVIRCLVAARCLLLLLAFLTPALTAQGLRDWKVDSSVSAIVLADVEQAELSPAGRHVRLNLRNISYKAVSAIVVTTSDGVRHVPQAPVPRPR